MKKTMMRALIGLLLLGPGLAAQAQDQAYPTRPLRLIVPFPAGGGVDAAARLVAAGMGKTLGQTVIVENRAGAAGTVGTELVAKSRPDGYTLCWCPTGPLTLTPLSDPAVVMYHPLEDLMGVSEVVEMDNVIMARSDFPLDTLQAMQELSRNEGRQFTYGTPGAGGTHHLGGEWLANMTGIKLRHVPYKGESPAVADLLGGHIDLVFGTALAAYPHVTAGKFKVLANLGKVRSQLLPQAPTVAEAGFPSYGWNNFIGINVRAGTPTGVVQKLAGAISRAVQDPAVQHDFTTMGMRPVGSSPAAYEDFLRKETAIWRKLLAETPLSRQ